jgi:hypothetical protein
MWKVIGRVSAMVALARPGRTIRRKRCVRAAFCENLTRDAKKHEETTMKKWIAMSAAAALLAGITAASAQSPSTPGAGSPGQDQRGADQAGAKKTPGQPTTKDAPPEQTTGVAPRAGAPKAPSMGDKESIHQSAGDRDSRGTPKQ